MLSLEERFWSKVDRSAGAAGCWPWLASTNTYGYGVFYVSAIKRSDGAHRVAWKLLRGDVPDGLCVLHRCDNPPCCNVERCHFLGTDADNVRDRDTKGRTAKGEHSGRRLHPDSYVDLHLRRSTENYVRGDDHWLRKNPERAALHTKAAQQVILRGEEQAQAKLTDDAVREMRRLYAAGGTSYPILARQFGISLGTTYSAITRKTWKHIP